MEPSPHPPLETVYVCDGCRAVRRTRTAFCYGCGSRRALRAEERPAAGAPLGRGGGRLVEPPVDFEEGEDADGDEDGDEDYDAREERVPPSLLPQLVSLAKVKLPKFTRLPSGIEGFDRVVGEEDNPGAREGMAFLISGARGSGKSTILLQGAAGWAAQGWETVYGGGEGEGKERLRATADRIGLRREDLHSVHFLDLHGMPDGESKIDLFLDRVDEVGAKVAIIDSLQGFAADPMNPRELAKVAKRAMRFAFERNVLIWMVGHLNGAGDTAGGQLAQHMGDGVFVLEKFGDPKKKIVRFYCDGKNRGGWDTEDCFFKVTRKGICEYDPDDDDRARDREAREETSRWRPVNRRSAPAGATSTTGRRGRPSTA
jgi:predicted ATP-dependent serine protease